MIDRGARGFAARGAMASLLAVFVMTVLAVLPARAQAVKPTSLSETYGNWTVSCREVSVDGKATRRCQMAQELQEKGANGRRVLGLVVTLQEGGAELTVVTPLGIALANGVSIELGEAPLLKAAYSTCRPAGCFASGALTAKLVASLEAATEATARLTALEGQPITIKFPLAGFPQARKRLAELIKG